MIDTKVWCMLFIISALQLDTGGWDELDRSTSWQLSAIIRQLEEIAMSD
jgi:hypothetical protein